MNVPTSLGKYTLRAVLGRGAMGTVYDGWDQAIDRRVAIKTVRLPVERDAEAQDELARFKRGAQAAGRLTHSNIVGVFDYGEADDVAFIVMEFVEGRTLKEVLAAEHLSVEQVLGILQDVLAGLGYSHEQGVVHRDIKPGNIMITPGGRAKIADYGIARIESSTLTEAGTIMGTPAYMSPEQFMGQAVDRRTDIYSAGVMLYQLLTGERPFEGTLATTMHKVLNTVPPRPSELSVTAPPALDAVVARAMARRPDDRYPTAEAFAEALLLDEGPDDATIVAPAARFAPNVSAPQPNPARPADSPRPGKRPVWPALAAAAVVLTGAGAWLLLSQGTPAPSPIPAPSPAVAPVPPAPVAPPVTPTPPPAPPTAPATPPAPPRAPTPAPVPVVPAPVTPAPAAPSPVAPAPLVPAPLVPAPITPAPIAPPAPAPALASPAPSPPAPQPAMPVIPSQPATPMPLPPPPRAMGDVRAELAASIPRLACSLADVEVRPAALPPGGLAAVLGLVHVGDAARALRQSVEAARPAGIDWGVTEFEGPYCPAIDLVRAMRQPGAPRLRAALASGRTVLHDGQIIALNVAMPELGGYLLVDYFQQNGDVVHMVPSEAYLRRAYGPREAVVFGRPRSDFKDGWQVGDPYGTDMIMVFFSTAPLFAQPRLPQTEKAGVYLRDLQAAIDDLRNRGGRLAADLAPVETQR